jgi:hypothetical protein
MGNVLMPLSVREAARAQITAHRIARHGGRVAAAENESSAAGESSGAIVVATNGA